MLLANIVLKIDKIGSSVPLSYVTPAEVLMLVADHNTNAGGDPIVSLIPIRQGAEDEPVQQALADIAKFEEMIKELETKEITEELRKQRNETYLLQLNIAKDRLAEWEWKRKRHHYTPAQERSRLAQKYSPLKILKVFPGAIPSVPETFEEARMVGIRTVLPTERLISVGDIPQAA